jgi:hypothetical protein
MFCLSASQTAPNRAARIDHYFPFRWDPFQNDSYQIYPDGKKPNLLWFKARLWPKTASQNFPLDLQACSADISYVHMHVMRKDQSCRDPERNDFAVDIRRTEFISRKAYP